MRKLKERFRHEKQMKNNQIIFLIFYLTFQKLIDNEYNYFIDIYIFKFRKINN